MKMTIPYKITGKHRKQLAEGTLTIKILNRYDLIWV